MNGLVTPGGTSTYMTYRLTTSVRSFRALWTCPWPMSTNDSPGPYGMPVQVSSSPSYGSVV
jgi:hypothetical protein